MKNSPRLTVLMAAFPCLLLALGGCDQKSKDSPSSEQASQPAAAPPDSIEVLFSYGSEKQNWIDDVTNDFNSRKIKIASGKPVWVRAVPSGSGESMEEILAGRTHAHLWSPASGVFVRLANARSQLTGGPLVASTQDLVLSPVVIAMWKPMAEALGWPNKPIGWSDIIALANDPGGWASHGHAEFGPFKLGHTHPEYSNSGLISILAETYAAAGKVRGLTASDLDDPKVGKYVEDVEQSVVHYGRSTGFFGRHLFDDGPQYLSAAVLYENMVVESYSRSLAMPIVAIYPKEGTFWSDHPIGIVQRDWVDDAHREAAGLYIKFLREPAQQSKALRYGFRPAEGDLGAPIDIAHGVDPRQPNTVLELPAAPTIDRVIELWRQHKKPASVVIVFDRSGSMNDDNKITFARNGALQLLDMLSDRDTFGLVPFSSQVAVFPSELLASGRSAMRARISGIQANGETNLYEAISVGHKMLNQPPQPRRICAVVVLTDGEDNGRRVSLEQLLSQIHASGELGEVRIFTIGYGKSARLDDLKKISKETHGEFYKGTTDNIRAIFKDIATFF